MMTFRDMLRYLNPQYAIDALRKLRLDLVLAPKQVTVSQAADTTLTLSPPALVVQSVRVTTGVATGVYIPSDEHSTPVNNGGATAPGTVSVTDDGATLTFASNVEVVVISYIQRPDTDLDTKIKGVY